MGCAQLFMKKEYKNDVLSGYNIGDNILVHSHIHCPESWFLTIRPLQIFAQSLCKKDCTEDEIARYINVELHKKQVIINRLIEAVVPFT